MEYCYDRGGVILVANCVIPSWEVEFISLVQYSLAYIKELPSFDFPPRIVE